MRLIKLLIQRHPSQVAAEAVIAKAASSLIDPA